MKLSTRGLLAGPWVGALFALLLAGSVAPREARAGCSNQHHDGRQTGGGPADGLEMLSPGGASAPDAPGEGSRPGPRPCSGVFCSGNPATPFSAPPSVPPPWSGHWALPAFLAAVAEPRPFAFPPHLACLSPVDHACSIFRPPRALTPAN